MDRSVLYIIYIVTDKRQIHVHICMKFCQKNVEATFPKGKNGICIQQSALGHRELSVYLLFAYWGLFVET